MKTQIDVLKEDKKFLMANISNRETDTRKRI